MPSRKRKAVKTDLHTDAPKKKKMIPTVTFEDPSQQQQLASSPQQQLKWESKRKVVDPSDPKLRHEIMKFAMNNNADKASKEEQEERMLISLGARKMRGKGVNYRVILEQRKAEKEKKKEGAGAPDIRPSLKKKKGNKSGGIHKKNKRGGGSGGRSR